MYTDYTDSIPTEAPYQIQERKRDRGVEAAQSSHPLGSTDFWYLIGYFLDSKADYTNEERVSAISMCVTLADPDTVPEVVRASYT